MAKVLGALAVSLSLVACTTEVVEGTGGPNGDDSSAQCRLDADCAYLDTDGDDCTKAICQSGRCAESLVRGTAECQCHQATDCTYYERQACNQVTCDAHKCSKKTVPAGPAPVQNAGDCATDVCDGSSEVATKQYDESDLGDTANPCMVRSCGESGIQATKVDNGTACNGDGICFEGACMTCKPQNASSCGGEGPGEPSNDSSSSPAAYPQDKAFCAFSSGSDIDWYTFNAEDKDLSYDSFRFTVWSTAPTVEVCVYVKCGSGSPMGACGTKLPGPNGSQGCCWSGAPDSVKPTWDLDCSGTGEDSGTAYVSVRTPGGGTCEPYAIVGGY